VTLRIEHVAIWTEDLQRLAEFYCAYFGATAGPLYVNSSKGFQSRFLSFEGGARIELMTSSKLNLAKADRGAQRCGLAHVALSMGAKQAVDDLTLRLRQNGVDVVDGPRQTGDGYYESVVLDPDGNRIEITI
jgi:lactoylglutathione lyase